MFSILLSLTLLAQPDETKPTRATFIRFTNYEKGYCKVTLDGAKWDRYIEVKNCTNITNWSGLPDYFFSLSPGDEIIITFADDGMTAVSIILFPAKVVEDSDFVKIQEDWVAGLSKRLTDGLSPYEINLLEGLGSDCWQDRETSMICIRQLKTERALRAIVWGRRFYKDAEVQHRVNLLLNHFNFRQSLKVRFLKLIGLQPH